MKDEITITQKQFHEAVGKAIEDLNEKSKKSQNSPTASMVFKMLYTLFAAELLIVLFKDEDEDNLEIEEKN